MNRPYGRNEMKTLILILALLLTGCGESPTEPITCVDICVEDAVYGGYTITICGGDTVSSRPERPEVRVDSLVLTTGE